MKRLTLALILALDSGMISCKASPAEESDAKTDLGSAGNQRVARTFQAYQGKAEHCAAAGNGIRVILTGFGLFSGANFNPSGTVVSSFADPAFQGDTITLSSATSMAAVASSAASTGDGQGPVASGSTDNDARGGIARNREITIDGTTYEVCFLTLDVLWDLAGAITVFEAHQFHPKLIIMSGRNSVDDAVWEQGAVNDATRTAGYNYNGTSASDSRPLRNNEPILSTVGGKYATMAMTWDNKALFAATGDMIKAISSTYTPKAPDAWRTGNNYVCNNISLVTLAAQAGDDLPLAGGALTIPAADADIGGKDVKVGFFHYPYNASNSPSEVKAWIQVLATAIKTAVGPDAATTATGTGTGTGG